LQGALDRVSIAVVDGSTITYANFGANEHTQYEIGSIIKTSTALLLADAIRRGEVTADTKAGALPPLGGAPIADVKLAERASHRSGLLAQGMQLDDGIRSLCPISGTGILSPRTWMGCSPSHAKPLSRIAAATSIPI
jgi:CubicO group peptidase (beta-lactamase class C family)